MSGSRQKMALLPRTEAVENATPCAVSRSEPPPRFLRLSAGHHFGERMQSGYLSVLRCLRQ